MASASPVWCSPCTLLSSSLPTTGYWLSAELFSLATSAGLLLSTRSRMVTKTSSSGKIEANA